MSTTTGLVGLTAVLTLIAAPVLSQTPPQAGRSGRTVRLPQAPAAPPSPPPQTSEGGATSAHASHVEQELNPHAVDSVRPAQRPGPGWVGMVDSDGKAAHQVTPGGVYRLVGGGFGDGKGQVRLLSPRWPGGVQYLTVQTWTDSEVTVAMPNVWGMPDFPVPGAPNDTLTLQVTTAAGEIRTLSPDPSFYAARRRETADPAFIHFMADLSGADQSWPLASQVYTWQKGVFRYKSGSEIGCPNPGQDLIRLTLHNNWAVTRVLTELGTHTWGDTGQDARSSAGSTSYTGPKYLISLPTIHPAPGTQNHIVEFTVDWGVYRSHHSGPMLDDSKRDECTSQYFLIIGLEGPQGVSPWSD